MRASAVCEATLKRLISPLHWGLILMVSVLWNIAPLTLHPVRPPFGAIISPIYWSFIILMICPMPWQWSGDDRPLPPLLRGLLQALIWDSFWIVGIVALVIMSHSNPNSHAPQPWGPHRPVKMFMFISVGPLLAGLTELGLGLGVGWLLAQKERAEVGEQEAVQATIAVRMHVIQSQMNPHVLFNALGGVTELLREDPLAAENALLGLSDLLRYLLDYGAKNSAPLAYERDNIERYLAIEHIRLGNRLRVAWDWDRDLESYQLPPLMLQPLVENAIKHGIAPHPEGGEIRIRLAGVGQVIQLEVVNTGVGLLPNPQEGIGLRNTRARLRFHDDAATLSLTSEGDWTRALIQVRRS